MNRTRAELWTNKIVQAPRQIPQTKKVGHVIFLPGPQRALLVRAIGTPVWSLLPTESQASSSSAVAAGGAVVPQDLMSILLPPGHLILKQKLGGATAVLPHSFDPVGKDGLVTAGITVGTLNGFVATFYWRQWSALNPKEGQWLLTAVYRHIGEGALGDDEARNQSEEETAVTSLWGNDELLVSATDAHNFSFWNRIAAGDTPALAATAPKPAKNSTTIEPVQLMMSKHTKGLFCRHSFPLSEVNPQIMETFTCAGVCSHIRSSRLKEKDAPTCVTVSSTVAGCASQVVMALPSGGVVVWAQSPVTPTAPSYAGTVQLTSKTILNAVNGGAAVDPTQKVNVLQVRLLDDSKTTAREGLAVRDRLVTLLQLSTATSPPTIVLAVWQLEYMPAIAAPKLVLAAPLGPGMGPNVAAVLQPRLFSLLKSTVIVVVLPHVMHLVALSNGQSKCIWSTEEITGEKPNLFGKNLPVALITATTCQEDFGVVVTAHSDLKMRLWSAESGGLQLRLIDMNAGASAGKGGGSWVSSTKFPIRVLHVEDRHSLVAVDPHCVYLRFLKK